MQGWKDSFIRLSSSDDLSSKILLVQDEWSNKSRLREQPNIKSPVYYLNEKA